MNLYSRLAGSHFGSSAFFGGMFFVAMISDGVVEAAAAGSLAATSWFAIVPLMKRLTGGDLA